MFENIHLENTCWVFKGKIVRVDGRRYTPRQAMWGKIYGYDTIPSEIPNTCGNKFCVNPSHFVIKPDVENLAKDSHLALVSSLGASEEELITKLEGLIGNG
jgi:hypothetical protein